MEYEKKYNDLIARINEVKEKPRLCMKDKHHYNGYVETGIRDALDYIVSPESEDERVRTRLIALVEAFGQGKYKDEMLAYLEKQKESLYRDKIDQHIKEILDGTYKMREHLYECSKSLKQKEQKPAEWSEEDERRYISCLQRLGTGNPNQPETINSKWFKEHVSPQPHWKPSEEDLTALEYCAEHTCPELLSLYLELKKL